MFVYAISLQTRLGSHGGVNNNKAELFKSLHFAIQVQPTTFNFRHSGSVALSPQRQSVRMSEINYGRSDLYGTKHSKCNWMMTTGFKGLTSRECV